MNDRFDDELRHAAAPLAHEELPEDVLDPRLDNTTSPTWWTWPRTLATAAGGATLGLALAIGLGLGGASQTGDSPPERPRSSEWPSPISGCPVLAPSELPSGAVTPAGRSIDLGAGPMVSWGSGIDTVMQRVEVYDSDVEMPPAERVTIRGLPGFVTPVGDGPESNIQMWWVDGDCLYLVWVGPGLTVDEAIEYAERY
jgi:hypothetical protein